MELSNNLTDPAPAITLTMGAILPHTRLFGGVKRFFELAHYFEQRGHKLIVFTPEGIKPDWYSGSVDVRPLHQLASGHLDAIFLTETDFLEDFLRAPAQLKIFYHVGPRVSLRTVLKHPEVVVFVNSSNMFDLDKRRYGISAVRALGGIRVPPLARRARKPGDPFTVMAYGRLSRRGKGTKLVVKACEKLQLLGYPIKLLLFDTPVDEKSAEMIRKFRCKVPFEFVVNHPVDENHQLFSRADVFVAAEKKGGWSNTAAEALAAGTPLVGTSVGTKDFLIHKVTGLRVWRHPFFIRRAIERLIKDPALAETLAANGRKKIETFRWDNLADFIGSFVLDRLKAAAIAEK